VQNKFTAKGLASEYKLIEFLTVEESLQFAVGSFNPDWVEDVRSGKQLPLYKSEEANVAYTDEPLP